MCFVFVILVVFYIVFQLMFILYQEMKMFFMVLVLVLLNDANPDNNVKL